MGLSKDACDKSYNFLSNVYNSRGYLPSRIWNADESGISASAKNGTMKVIGVRGSRSVMNVGSGSRKRMTIMAFSNALGYSLPNLYIFTGERKKVNYVEDCETHARMAMSQHAGWITEKIFLDWLNHFKEHVPGGVSLQNKHLLIVDGHKTYMTLAVVTRAAN